MFKSGCSENYSGKTMKFILILVTIFFAFIFGVNASTISFKSTFDSEIVYDSNLIKGNKSLISKNVALNDVIKSYGVSTTAQGSTGLQNFEFHASAAKLDYKNNDLFDHTSENVYAMWELNRSKSYSILLEADYSKGIANFLNNNYIAQFGEIEKIYKFNAGFNKHITSHSSLYFKANEVKRDYSSNDFGYAERDIKEAIVGATIQSNKGSRFSLEVSRLTNEFPNRILEEFDVDRKYSINKVESLIYYNHSPKLSMFARFGWLDVINRNFSERDFSDLTSGLSLFWQPSEKINFTQIFLRQVAPSDTPIGVYTKSKISKTEVTYHFSEKILFQSYFEYKEQAFLTSAIEAQNGSSNVEEVSNEIAAKANYEFNKNVSLELKFSYKERDSDIEFRKFGSNAIGINFNVKW